MSVKVNHRQTLYKGRVFDFTRENLTLDGGVTFDLEIIRHPGAAAIVALLDAGTVVLIRQYRHALGRFIHEIPAGTLDGAEAPLACAKRELIEETGYAARKWEKLGEITPVPGYSDERIHLYLAEDLSAVGQHLDADEVLQVEPLGLKRAMEMIHAGEIQDAKTIAALCLASHRLAAQ